MNINNCFFKPTTYFKPIYETWMTQQKKIVALAMAIFSCVAIYYVVKHLIGKERRPQVVKDVTYRTKNPLNPTLQVKTVKDIKNSPVGAKNRTPPIKAAENMENSLVGAKELQSKKVHLTTLAEDLQLSIVEILGAKEWNSLTSAHRSLHQLSKKPRAVAVLLENTRAPIFARLQQIILAGSCLHKLNLRRSNLSDIEHNLKTLYRLKILHPMPI